MRINLGTVVRASVPPTVIGVCWLDRSTSAAYALSAEFLAAVEEFAPGSERAPTVGHNQIAISHPTATKHTYKFGDFSTVVRGNYWNPDYNQPGYVDEDGHSGDGTGLDGAGPISEIVGLTTFCDHTDAIQAQGVLQRVHYVLDVDAAWSEGLLRGDLASTTPGPYADADLDWYRNPEGTSGSAFQDKVNENNAIIQELWDRGYRNVVIMYGGERWRGWPGALGNGPWGPDTGTDSNDKYHWLSDHAAPVIQASIDYMAAHGITGYEGYVSALESVTGGRLVPLDTANRDRNRAHLNYDISVNGANYQGFASSTHYRGDWNRWLSEPQMRRDGSLGMQYAFITDSGQASWQQAWDYAQAAYGKKFLPMANSVGDAQSTLVWTPHTNYPVDTVVQYTGDGLFYAAQSHHTSGDDFSVDLGNNLWALTPGTIDEETGDGKPPGTLGQVQLPQWQMGLVAAQQLIEQMTSDIEVAQFFPGIAGDHEHAGFSPDAGLCGMVDGVFTKFPTFHALKTFGPILQRGADLIDVTVTETGLVQCVLQYEQDGKTKLANWLINKAYSGAVPNETGLAQTVDIEIPTPYLPYFEPTNVRRFSETETTLPNVSGIVSTTGNRITVELAPFSITYFEVEIQVSGLRPNKYRDPGHFHKYTFH